MPKILFLFNHPAPYKVDLFNELAKYHDFTALFERKRNRNRPDDFYHSSNYRFHAEFLKGLCLGEENHLSFGAVRYIRKHRFDLIVINGYSSFTEMITLDYLIRKKIPYVLYFNGTFKTRGSALNKSLKKRFITHAAYCVTSTPLADDDLVSFGARKENIFHYAYSTVFQSELSGLRLGQEDKNLLKTEKAIPHKPLFVMAGQFVKRKNNLELIRIFAKRPEYVLMLAGDGKERESYIRYVKDNNLKNIIIDTFLGKEELLSLYRIADASITLSTDDIYGHAVNESFSQGLPIISSDKVTSARHLVKHGKNGYIVRDEEETLKAMDAVVKKNMYVSCLATARENTVEIMVRNHLDIFRELIR